MAATAGKIKAGQAYVEITADNSKLMRGLQNAQSALKSFGQGLKGIGADMMQLGGVLSLPFVAAVRSFASFDDKIKELGAISGASESQMTSLQKMIRNLGASTAFTAQQVAHGTVELARMGFTAFELSNAIKPVMDLVRATGTETFRLGEVSEYASATLRQFNLTSSQFTDVCDVMAYATNRSAMKISDLGEAMKIAGPSAKAVNEDVRDTASALMLMSNAGIKGSLAGTALRKVYQSLAAQSGNLSGMNEDEKKNAKKGKQQLHDMGIQLVDQDTGNMRKAADIMFDLAKKVRQMKTGQKINFATDVFDLRGSLGALSMLNDASGLQDFRKQLNNVSGYASKTAQKMEKSIGGLIRLIISQVQEMQIAVGEAFWETFKYWIEKIPKVTKAIIAFINANKKLVGQIAIVIGSTFLFGAALFGLGAAIKIISFGLGGLIVGMKTITTAVLLPVNALILLKNTFLSFSNILQIVSLSLTSFWAVCKSAVILGSAFTGLLSIHKSLRLIHGSSKFASAAMSMFSAVVRTGAGFWKIAFSGLSVVIRAMIGVLYTAIGTVKLLQYSMLGIKYTFIGIAKSMSVLKIAFGVFGGFIKTINIVQLAFSVVAGELALFVNGMISAMAGASALTTAIISLSSYVLAFSGTFIGIMKSASIVSVLTRSFAVLRTAITAVMIPLASLKNGLIAVSNTFNVFFSARSSVLSLLQALRIFVSYSFVLSGAVAALFMGIINLISPIGLLYSSFAIITSVLSSMIFSVITAGVAMAGTGNIAKLLNAALIGLKSTVIAIGGVFNATRIIFQSTILAFRMFIPIMHAFITAGLSGALVMQKFTFITNLSRAAWLSVRFAINGVTVAMGAYTSSMIVSKTTATILVGMMRVSVGIYNAVRVAILAVSRAYIVSKAAVKSLFTAQKAYNGIMIVSTSLVHAFSAAIRLLKTVILSLKTAVAGLRLSALAGSFWYVTAAIVGGIIIWKTFVAVCSSLKGVFSNLMSGVSSFGSSLKSFFSSLWSIGKEAAVIAKDSLFAGDTAGAAKVALAALYLIWVEGITPIYKLWIDFKKNLIDTWIGFKANILLITNDIWYGMLEGLAQAGILDSLDVICVGIVNAFDAALTAIYKAWRTLRGKMAGKSDAEIKIVTDAYDRYYKSKVADREKRLQERIAGRKNGGITKQRDAAAKKINEDAQKASEENKKDHRESQKKADKRLDDARENYDNAKEYASQWNTMNAAVKALQKKFEHAQEDYRLKYAPQDIKAKNEEERFKKLKRSNPDKADQEIRAAVIRERDKAEKIKEVFDNALEEAKADRVIDSAEKMRLTALAKEYGRANELYHKYNTMLGNAAVGTSNAISMSTSNSRGTFSAYEAFYGAMGDNDAAQTAKNTADIRTFAKKMYDYMITNKGLVFN